MTDRPPLDYSQQLPVYEVLRNEHACSYLPNLEASLPLLYLERRATAEEFDFAMNAGLRRSGMFLYYASCAACTACEPSRVDVNRFQLTRSMKRVLQRGDAALRISAGIPRVDQVRIELFNRHRNERALGESGGEYSTADYEQFLVDSCCSDSLEIGFWKEEELVGVSIVDCGKNCLSAVYTYFNPDYSKLSIGSYSILKQFQIAQKTDRQYVYLGMYVAANPHLNYKARFLPQERFVGGQWVLFEPDQFVS